MDDSLLSEKTPINRGMSEGDGSRQPYTLTWEGVRYTLPSKRKFLVGPKVEAKEILHSVSGFCKPGQLLAIIGSSGAGKSTLLDVLAQRKNPKQVKGQVLINGERPNKAFKRISAYVTQDDALEGLLTVRETLQFYARIQLPSSVSSRERERRVQAVLEELGLEHIAENYVGSQFRRGISGGELKRLSVGCQLITDPSILFLDEPTTGLDAFNSQSVMETLNRLAKRGRTIICTIHQPRSTIYDLFDQLMILSQGHVVYFGPASEAVPYFASVGFQCGTYINPADFFIDTTILNEKYIGNNAEEEGVDLVASYQRSENCSYVQRSITEMKSEFREQPAQYKPAQLRTYANNWFIQLWVVCWRLVKTIVRNPIVTYAQLGQTLFMALLVGSIYFDIGLTQQSIQDRVGAIFFIVTNQTFSMFASLTLFLEGRGLFNRERAQGCYSTSVYFFAKTCIELPFLLLFPLVFSSIAYWMIGFQPTGKCFGSFTLTLIILTAVAASLFLAIGAASPNMQIAQIFSPLITVLFMIFGGFFVNNESIPPYYSWIKYISFFNYAFATLCNIEFNGFGDPLVFTDCTPGNPCIANGNQELELLGISTDDSIVWQNWCILAGMVVGYRIIAYVLLRVLFKERT